MEDLYLDDLSEHLQLQLQPQPQPQLQQILSSVNIIDSTGGGDYKQPQWSIQETKDFLMIRAELDPSFTETRKNKLFWEVTSTKMKDIGYNRSVEQCKYKWKNLITRYKEIETKEAQGMKWKFTYYNEVQAILTARMQRKLWKEAEESLAGGSNLKTTELISYDIDKDEKEENRENQGGTTSSKKKKRKITNKNNDQAGASTSGTGNIHNNIVYNEKDLLGDFMNQQIEMEKRWLKAYEIREEERKIREIEWRRKMEALENERMIKEMIWREREEQWRVREEARAENRDALITQLLNKLGGE